VISGSLSPTLLGTHNASDIKYVTLFMLYLIERKNKNCKKQKKPKKKNLLTPKRWSRTPHRKEKKNVTKMPHCHRDGAVQCLKIREVQKIWRWLILSIFRKFEKIQ
jgi:hypothetical protein